MDHDSQVGGGGQLRAEDDEATGTIPRTAQELEDDVDFTDIDRALASSHRVGDTHAGIDLLAIVARELKMLRVALAERNALLAESNDMVRAGRKPTQIDMRVDVATDGQDGTQLAKDLADAVGAEFDRVFRGGS